MEALFSVLQHRRAPGQMPVGRQLHAGCNRGGGRVVSLTELPYCLF
jgi:hypothetical protein